MNQDYTILKRKSRSVSSFLNKTYKMLDDQDNYYAIQWSQSGVGFVVLKQQQFSKQVLPKYFKHSNFSSFVRQLNMYNFHKIREANCQSHFHHEYFRKDNKQSFINFRSLLSQIRRKPQKKKRRENSQEEEEQIDQVDNKSSLSIKVNKNERNPFPSIVQKFGSEDGQIKSYKQSPRKLIENTRHNFVSQKENRQIIPSVVYHMNLQVVQKQDKFDSKERISIQNILSGSIENDDDKLSINNELAEVFPRIPTKEIFYPSNNNIFQLPLRSNVKGTTSNFSILF